MPDTVKVRLTSDYGVEKYGFGIVSVVDPDAQPEEGGEDSDWLDDLLDSILGN